jgi:glycosyltransferase involved in cell wall biosynthesis
VKPLRLTIVTGPWYPTPPGKAGAVERIWGDLALRFARRGHLVTVLSRGEAGLPPRDTTQGVHTIRRTRMSQGKHIYIDLLKDLAYSARMLPLLPQADVCVTNAFWLPTLARLRGPGIGKLYVSIARVPKGQLFLYANAARLHAVSGFIKDAIIAERPAYAKRTRAIPNPIDLQFFTPPNQPRDLTNSSGRGRTILYTGRIHPEKGVHVLVSAFARARATFPDLRLRLVGPSAIERGGGGEPYLTRLRALAGAHPVAIDPPIYDRAALAQTLRDATYYCYPSLAEAGESFGVAPLEAGATGLAAIVSDLPAFKEFLVDDDNGLVFDHRGPACEDNLLKQVQRLVADPALAQRLGDRAIATAQRYDYETVADEFLSDFESLLNENGGQP